MGKEKLGKLGKENIIDGVSTMLPSDTGLHLSKSLLFLGLTSGSALTGFSMGLMVGARDSQCWLSSAVSSVVARLVWDSVGKVIFTGVVGTSLLGLSSYKFWGNTDSVYR